MKDKHALRSVYFKYVLRWKVDFFGFLNETDMVRKKTPRATKRISRIFDTTNFYFFISETKNYPGVEENRTVSGESRTGSNLPKECGNPL